LLIKFEKIKEDEREDEEKMRFQEQLEESLQCDEIFDKFSACQSFFHS
jgi:hypothetical protein